ncbi:MAG TPA: hypothetical protein VK582_05205 [Pyrinomonadaceae bacterium]|nr:hypothetical protein [Pyrinomonadaceae bacterium]
MVLSPESQQRIKELLRSALQLDPDQRVSFLDRACAGDLSLRQEVESLIAMQEQATGSVSSLHSIKATTDSRGEQMTAVVGQSIAHYKVLSSLGRGGMGEVYLAQDSKLGRKVALKLLPPAFSNDEDRLRRFEREAAGSPPATRRTLRHLQGRPVDVLHRDEWKKAKLRKQMPLIQITQLL